MSSFGISSPMMSPLIHNTDNDVTSLNLLEKTGATATSHFNNLADHGDVVHNIFGDKFYGDFYVDEEA